MECTIFHLARDGMTPVSEPNLSICMYIHTYTVPDMTFTRMTRYLLDSRTHLFGWIVFFSCRVT